MKNKIDNLLARYFGGNASEFDMLTLEQWISLLAENQLYFDQLTNLYAKLGDSNSNIPKPNTELAKKSFMAYLSIQKNNQPKQILSTKSNPFYKQWMFQAASLALILTISISTWLIYTSEHDVVLATRMTIKEDILPDQTQIKLSKNSKIIYSSKYGKKSRTIRLVGKAFFAVGHKGKGTLQIKANETLIEDIGTKFTVSAYPDSDKVSVNVGEGKVHFYTSKNNGLTILANQTGIYNKQTKEFAVLKPAEIAKDIKHIQFSGISLHDAMEIIGKDYGVVILFEKPSIGERKITVNFDGENVDMVLQVIAETLNLKVTKRTNRYLLSNNKNLLKQ